MVIQEENIEKIMSKEDLKKYYELLDKGLKNDKLPYADRKKANEEIIKEINKIVSKYKSNKNFF